jgi:MerR family mercuric resistance operon transcriptional regulator
MPRKEAGGEGLLTRGVLAARSGCHIETIRYYERIGVLPPPPRSGGGHRLYNSGLVRRLNFVRRGRELGFTLEEIRGLLRLVDGGKYTCGQIEKLAQAHAHDIERKIADLRKMKSVLTRMAMQCHGGTIPKCPIVDALFDSSDLASAPHSPRP